MIYALVALAAFAQLTTVVVATLAYRERRQIIGAMLQATGATDAARRLAPAPSKAEVQAQVELQREIMENGGVFTAQNPFGNPPPKPLGV